MPLVREIIFVASRTKSSDRRTRRRFGSCNPSVQIADWDHCHTDGSHDPMLARNDQAAMQPAEQNARPRERGAAKPHWAALLTLAGATTSAWLLGLVLVSHALSLTVNERLVLALGAAVVVLAFVVPAVVTADRR